MSGCTTAGTRTEGYACSSSRAELPEYDAEVRPAEKVVGRVTSAARDGEHVVALAYVRVDVPPDAELTAGARSSPA